jgi:hypothetical protein
VSVIVYRHGQHGDEEKPPRQSVLRVEDNAYQ